MPSCISDLSAAAIDLKREHPREFGDSGALAQALGLYVFSYSCGSLVGPTAAGLIKARVGWGAATVILTCACAVACVPIVSPIHDSPQQGKAHRMFRRWLRHQRLLAEDRKS